MENLTRKQQAMWPVIESGRQIVAFFKWPLKKWAEYGVEVDRRNALAAQLEELTDPTLLDRMSSFAERGGPIGIPQITEIRAPRPVRSIDGILRAV